MPDIQIPSEGQLVLVRGRRFVVSEVEAGGVPSDPIHAPLQRLEHLVRLSPLDDDEALDETVQVVWEVEPGAQVLGREELPEPDGFDPPAKLDAFLDAVRWGAVSSADVRSLQAPFRSGIEIDDYQLDAAARAIRMPRVNLLVADDVGLGKTIEAGLVIQELILRHRARRILVVCPASLLLKWQEEMRDKFGLEFRIVDQELLHRLRRERGLLANPWTHFPRLITSIDWLKRERPLRWFRETVPPAGQPAWPRRYDLLVVDEAHNAAPSTSCRYALDSLRTQAVREISRHFEHRLFLTATPHNGSRASFTALLELVDDQRFARGVAWDPKQRDAVMIRNLKDDPVIALRPDGTRRFPEVRIQALEVSWTPDERALHAGLARYCDLLRAAGPDEASGAASEFLGKLLKKRLFSSPGAFATTLAKRAATLAKNAATPGHLESRGGSPAAAAFRRKAAEADWEEYDTDDGYEEATDEAADAAARLLPETSAEAAAALRSLRASADAAAARPDSKARALLAWIATHLRPEGRWTDRRVLVFTEYRATQKWLYEVFSREGLTPGGRVEMLFGGMDRDARQRIQRAFQADPSRTPVRILLATDTASEGIDLQRHCTHLFHYEIPWNPARLVQRNGRIDRRGNLAGRADIWHFVGAGWAERATAESWLSPGDLDGDLEFLAVVALKARTIREDLGRLAPVIASQVEEAMAGARRTLDTASAEADARRQRSEMRFARQTRENLARLREQLEESRRELRVSPENLEAVVGFGLTMAGHAPLAPEPLPGIWPDPAGRRARSPVFRVPRLPGSWAPCQDGLRDPISPDDAPIYRPVTFDPEVAAGRDDVVLIHLNHRLVQMCVRLLRAETTALAPGQALHRVTARLVPRDVLDVPALLAHGRLVVLGGDHRKLQEEVIAAGLRLGGGRAERLGVQEVERLLAAATAEAPSARALDSARAGLVAAWPDLKEPLRNALEARARDRTESHRRLLGERADREASDLAAILQELERGIRAELARTEEQLDLFDDEEGAQYRLDREALELRLRRIPAEIDEETRLIRARFEDPKARLFPVAVTWLLPRP